MNPLVPFPLDGNTAYLFGYYTKSNTSGDIYQPHKRMDVGVKRP
jgi:hypothetical protein